eukprot:3099905-Prymnesium_polylepis.1
MIGRATTSAHDSPVSTCRMRGRRRQRLALLHWRRGPRPGERTQPSRSRDADRDADRACSAGAPGRGRTTRA